MLLSKDSWRRISTFGPMLEAAERGGGGAGDLPADDSDIDAIEGLDDAGKKALRAERAARRAAKTEAAEAKRTLADVNKRLADLEKERADRDEADRKAREKASEDAGQFKELADQRERERDQMKSDLDALKAKFDALNTAATGLVKSDFDTLPEEIRDLYTGEAEDVVAMLAFIPKGKAAAARMSGGEENNSRNVEGATPNPPAKGDNTKVQTEADETARKAFAQTYY